MPNIRSKIWRRSLIKHKFLLWTFKSNSLISVHLSRRSWGNCSITKWYKNWYFHSPKETSTFSFHDQLLSKLQKSARKIFAARLIFSTITDLKSRNKLKMQSLQGTFHSIFPNFKGIFFLHKCFFIFLYAIIWKDIWIVFLHSLMVNKTCSPFSFPENWFHYFINLNK